MPSVLIHTLGCKLNQLESEAFADAFTQAGFSLYAPNGETSPELVIINTCTVTSKADQKARRVIRKAMRDYPDSCVLVTGCYAQLDKEQLKELESGGEGRLFVIKGSEKEVLLKLPDSILKSVDIRGAIKTLCMISEQREVSSGQGAKSSEHGILSSEQSSSFLPTHCLNSVFQFNPKCFSEHTRGFLKIQDGCDKHCTYCRIRLARGPSVSLGAGEVLARLRVLEKKNAEAVLTGVNISQYRDEAAPNLGSLLEYLLSGTERIAVRLSSLAPETIDEDFIRVISHKRIRPHFHLSIQSCSKKILEKMGRDYDAKIIENAVSLLRHAKVDPFMACDIIAGFPGETEADFEQTIMFCKKLDFAWIHAFPYSKRKGTPAFVFPEAVHEATVTKRVQLLTNLANDGKAAYTRRWLGREVEALVEKGGGLGSCRGISENYLKLLVKCRGKNPHPPGIVLRCKIVEYSEKDVDCDAVGEEL